MSVPRSHRNRPNRHLRAVGPDTPPSAPTAGFDEPGDSLPEYLRDAIDSTLDLLSDLVVYVDDLDGLLTLDDEPLPDEPFDWSGVDPQDREIVAAVLERCDAACDALLDIEFRTIARRILTLLATRDLRALRRATDPGRVAAAIVWLAGQGNWEFRRQGARWRSASFLWTWFRVPSCADRGRSIRRAAGLVPDTSAVLLSEHEPLPFGRAALLHSRTRRWLITRRDARLRLESERRPWSLSLDGQSVAFRAFRAAPVAVAHGHDRDTDQTIVMLALGSPGSKLADAEVYGLSPHDARRLAEMLHTALGAT